MEEEKAAALYEELTRKGGGAARFKQGLGFSSATTTSNDPPSRGSALPSSSSSFMSNFVRASTQTKEIEVDKKTQIENIQNKLKKKEPISSTDKIRVRDKDRRRSSSREKNLRSRSRSRSRSRERRRSRSRSRSRGRRKRSTSRDREKNSRSRRRHSSFDEDRDRSRRRYRSSSRERRRKRSRGRSRSRSRSFSPSDRKRSERRRDGGGRDTKMVKESSNGTIDYAKSIDGYDNMTPAERVKAKMKLQLSQTAQKDTNLGSGSQWERFEFNKDAPVDDNEIEAADDDATLVKHIGRSFRFTSLEAKREDEIENAHDQAIFGVPAPIPSYTSETGEERASENKNANENKGSTDDDDPASSLISEKVLSKQQGSWRDRARKNVG